MQSSSKARLTVIGGTYRELDFDSLSHEIFGSGFRACKFLLENDCNVEYYTSGNIEIASYLKENAKAYGNLTFNVNHSTECISFKYSFPLANPDIFPGLLNISKTEDIIVKAEYAIAFGMIESDFRLDAKKVVYDPQTSTNPKKFSECGTAEQLVYIVNMSEASSLAKSTNLEVIKEYFFKGENAKALIIKN